MTRFALQLASRSTATSGLDPVVIVSREMARQALHVQLARHFTVCRTTVYHKLQQLPLTTLPPQEYKTATSNFLPKFFPFSCSLSYPLILCVCVF